MIAHCGPTECDFAPISPHKPPQASERVSLKSWTFDSKVTYFFKNEINVGLLPFSSRIRFCVVFIVGLSNLKLSSRIFQYKIKLSVGWKAQKMYFCIEMIHTHIFLISFNVKFKVDFWTKQNESTKTIFEE